MSIVSAVAVQRHNGTDISIGKMELERASGPEAFIREADLRVNLLVLYRPSVSPVMLKNVETNVESVEC